MDIRTSHTLLVSDSLVSVSKTGMAPKDSTSVNKLSGTDLIHADDGLHGPEVAPSLSVSTSKFAPGTQRAGNDPCTD